MCKLYELQSDFLKSLMASMRGGKGGKRYYEKEIKRRK